MKLILFEWKLMTRNKRLKQQFIALVLCIAMMIVSQLLLNNFSFLMKEFYIVMLFLLPFNTTIFTFGIQSAFIEKSLTTPLSMFNILQAKYRFNSILALMLFIVALPSIFFGIKLTELATTFIFTVGFTAFGLFCFALLTYKAFDIKSSSFANYQGIDAGSFWLPMLVLPLMLGIVVVSYLLFNEKVTLIIMSVIGLIFIATHKIWLKMIANKFYETKYKRLERFREK